MGERLGRSHVANPATGVATNVIEPDEQDRHGQGNSGPTGRNGDQGDAQLIRATGSPGTRAKMESPVIITASGPSRRQEAA